MDIIGSTDAEAEAPVFWSSDVNSDSLEKSLMPGEVEGRRRRGQQRMRWLEGITDAMDINLGRLSEMVRAREAWMLQATGSKESDTTGWLNNNNVDILPWNSTRDLELDPFMECSQMQKLRQTEGN